MTIGVALVDLVVQDHHYTFDLTHPLEGHSLGNRSLEYSTKLFSGIVYTVYKGRIWFMCKHLQYCV